MSQDKRYSSEIKWLNGTRCKVNESQCTVSFINPIFPVTL